MVGQVPANADGQFASGILIGMMGASFMPAWHRIGQFRPAGIDLFPPPMASPSWGP